MKKGWKIIVWILNTITTIWQKIKPSLKDKDGNSIDNSLTNK